MTWFLAHLIGDYLLQTDWMAANKKQNSWACLIHVCCYILPFILLATIIVQGAPLLAIARWQIVAIAVQHFLQDRTGFVVWFMKKKGQAAFAQAPMAPWSIIVTDNILHLVWIAFILTLGRV